MNALTNSICTFSELHIAEAAVTMVARRVVISVRYHKRRQNQTVCWSRWSQWKEWSWVLGLWKVLEEGIVIKCGWISTKFNSADRFYSWCDPVKWTVETSVVGKRGTATCGSNYFPHSWGCLMIKIKYFSWITIIINLNLNVRTISPIPGGWITFFRSSHGGLKPHQMAEPAH